MGPLMARASKKNAGHSAPSIMLPAVKISTNVTLALSHGVRLTGLAPSPGYNGNQLLSGITGNRSHFADAAFVPIEAF